MNDLSLWGDVATRLGWVLVHFLWQGAIIGMLAGLATKLIPRAAAQTRYAVLCLALAACAAAPVVTWFAIGPQVFTVPSATPGPATTSSHGAAATTSVSTPPAPVSPIAHTPASSAPALPAQVRPGQILETIFPYLVLAWGLGVLVLSFQLVFGWLTLHHLCDAGRPVTDAHWRARLDALCAQLQITRAIRFITSAQVDVPSVFGWWRPVLIVPATFFTSLPPNQIEAILVHELAHIRRHDYLMNLLQLVVETLLFYHPAVWWIGRAIRAERENCCDDLAVRVLGDKLTYVSALAALAETSSSPMTLSLAATDGSLLDRVRRILGQGELRAPRRAWSAPLALALIVAALLTACAYSYAEQAQADGDDPFGTVDFTKGSIDKVESYESAFRNAVIGDKVGLVAAFLRHGYKMPAIDLKSGVGDILSDAAYFTNDPKMVRVLLDHGAKPAGDPNDWHATVNQVMKNGNKEIVDMLIAAGAICDPDRYDAATGNVDGLKKRDAQHPLDAKKIDTLLDYAVSAGQAPTFDWLWAKAQKPDAAANAKKLAGFYEKAADNGRLGLLTHIEALGVKPSDGGTGALEGAIARNHVEVARHLFDKGVVLKNDPNYFRSPLAETAGAALMTENRIEMVTLLLDHGADINAKDKEGMTALSWAAYCGKDAVCQLLVQRGADPDIPDKNGRTAAWYLAGSSHCPGALELMLKKGAKIKWTDSGDLNLLDYAMNFVPPQQGVQGFPGEILTPAELLDYNAREEKVIDLLISAGLDPSGKEGTDTPLKVVIDANHYPAARALLRHHPNLNIKDTQGNPAITSLFDRCHSAFPLDVLATMLQQGADPNGSYPIPGLTPVTRTTVLQTAIGSFRGGGGSQLDDQRAAIRMLIDHGAKFPGVKSDADQAMLLAAVVGDQVAMKTALARGASPDTKDSYGYSPLLISMTLQYFDNVMWLLNNGANPKQNSTIWGNNLIPAAVSANRLDMVKLLLAKGLKPAGYELNDAVEHGNREMFDTLIKAGADPKSGSIFTCMQQGQAEMGKILLDGGADPQPPAFGENRANVYWAVYYNQPVILKAMLDHGADPTYISAYGESPLSEAREWHNDMVSIIEEALKRWPHLSPGGAIPPDLQDLAQKAADDLRQGHFDPASTKFEQMTKVHADSLYAWSNLGASRFQVMRYDQARDAFEHAVKLKPDDAYAVFNLGMTYYRLEKFDKALATLKTAVQLVPNDANVHYMLGVTYASLRQKKESDAEFQKTKDLQMKARPTP